VATLPPPESPTLKLPITEWCCENPREVFGDARPQSDHAAGRWLWGLDGATCDAALVHAKCFCRTREGLASAVTRVTQQWCEAERHERQR
jgi:hypothetical protein